MKKVVVFALVIVSLISFSVSAYSETATCILHEFTCTIPEGFVPEETEDVQTFKKEDKAIAVTSFSEFEVPRIPKYFSEKKAFDTIATHSTTYFELDSAEDVKVWKNKNGLYVASTESSQNGIFMKMILVYGVKDVMVLAFLNRSENDFSDLDPIIDTIETTIQKLDINMVDFSTLSYDELIALKDRINLAVWDSKEWQEVEVPQGLWEVGTDIPAGHWTIKTTTSHAYIKIGDSLNKNGKEVDAWSSNVYFSEEIHHPDSYGFDPKDDLTEMDIVLKNGMYVDVSNANVIFTPYSGKPLLGFK